ncbi:cupin domain-containing protein [Mesorhizobium sp.]|uniref:cupin domain-containing protein n=1 Tax=Mesorhizobium sp. TaxID=1871066 RepID=UPI0025DB6BAF|nr:cupin domain-containing protein [Mesorhizobium sp.]
MSNSVAETFVIPTSYPVAIPGPFEGSKRLLDSHLEWQATETPGFWLKCLYEDRELGEKTMLMKVDPGCYAGLHAHEGEFEQIFVLEGSFYDQDATMKAGDYCCRAPGALHDSGSVDGAVVLVIYTKRPA